LSEKTLVKGEKKGRGVPSTRKGGVIKTFFKGKRKGERRKTLLWPTF